MKITNEPRQYGTAALAFGLAGAAIYALMISVTLPHIEAVSGHVPFDMRPFGYDPQAAADLLDGLGEEGRTYYLMRQIPLDTAYPALLMMTLVSAIVWLGSDQLISKLGRAGIAFAVRAAVFDYAENLGVAGMILNWPNVLPALVFATSTASILKSCLTTAAVLMVCFLGAMRLRRPKVSRP